MKNVAKYVAYCSQIRRLIHQYPETGFDVKNTIKIIVHELDILRVPYIKNIGKSSLVASIGNGKPVIGFRADIDALNIEEQNDVSYKSTVAGKMHACGHDAHTAMLLTLIKYIVEEKVKINGAIKFIFQASEEGPESGGKLVCEDNICRDIDMYFAYHVTPNLETGKIGVKFGEMNASCDDFIIKMIGRSGHGAYPHQAIDPIAMAVEVYNMLHNLKARELEPTKKAVISTCVFKAGSANNVIPDTATLEGTVRTYNIDQKELIKKRIEEIVSGVAAIHHGSYELDYKEGCVPLINDDKLCGAIKEAVIQSVGEENYVELELPSMGVDDFAYYIQNKPGVMINLGVRNEEKGIVSSLHNSHFDIDEDCFINGLTAYFAITMKLLNTKL